MTRCTFVDKKGGNFKTDFKSINRNKLATLFTTWKQTKVNVFNVYICNTLKATMKILNFNVGFLGHVDSGKTSLAKVLSAVPSTAAFDKDPQSQERGITLDLGFSSFTSPMPPHLSNSSYDIIQFTLVDCPGHASLIKTIIGGSYIIDMMILVIDATKGFQTQTSECLIVGEIMRKKLIVVLNKIDMLEDAKSLEKLTKKVKLTLDSTFFKGCSIVCASALNNNVNEVSDALLKECFIPDRTSDKPFLYAVDHCFAVRGKGTVLTGTVLQGKVKINDEIEIPSIGLNRKVKSMEMFKKPVESAVQGDRVGICVTQFDPKTLERGLACQLNYVPTVYAAVIDFNKVKYYKQGIDSKSVFHITVGYENVTARVFLFGCAKNSAVPNDFDLKQEYFYVPEFNESTDVSNVKLFALLEFSKPILVVPNSIAIGGRLDAPIYSNSCRLAFYGNILISSSSKKYQTEFLPLLKVYKEKLKKGTIDRIANEFELVGKNMFKKETVIEKFVGMKINLSTGEEGCIESSFGQSGKFKVRIPNGIKETTMAMYNNKKKLEDSKSVPVEIILHHKRYIYDPEKKMIQS